MAEQRLGRFTLVRELGRGGMGVVYLATDDTLGRNVAVKTLPDELAKDRDRLARLEREAKALASVSHPSVATIHALEESDSGSRFLVLEYVEGVSLHQRLREGPLSLKQTLRFAVQMAEALEAAHQRGVVHRDFKPSNVMITGEDRIKVLDFGLAKSHVMDIAPDQLEASTYTAFNTQPGMVLGTPGFMSPEQSRGHELDHRTDIFSFGCVIFACLTGAGPFGGDNPSDAMAEMLTSEPPWSRLPEDTPTRLLELLIRMLAKNREQRIGGMTEIVVVVREIRDQFASGSSVSAAVMKAPSNLPATVTTFVGRERELGEIRSLWPRTRLLTLTGAGGCGKSRLAIRFVEDAFTDFVDGVCYVNLGSITSGDLVQQAILSGLGLKEEQSKSALGTAVEYLRARESIIFLDNCEHLIDDCAQVIDTLMQQCPGVKVVVTTRQSFGIAGESIYHVPSLSTPGDTTSITADEAMRSEAVRLFVERAASASPRFRLTDDNSGVVAQICKQIDGIPLAIELAAARVRSMPVGQVARRLDDSFRLLRGGSKMALERHQTLQATIDWSYGLLTEEEQTLLRRLAVFNGGWSLEAAEAVGSGDPIDELDVIDYLSQLVEKSLVVYEESEGVARYRLLETMRQYALAKLVESPEAAGVRDRHLAYFVELVEVAEPELRGNAESFQRLAMEMDNIFAALGWAMSAPDGATEALRLVAAAWRFWEIRGFFLTAHSLVTGALERASEDTDPLLLRRALYGAGAISVRRGDLEDAKSSFGRCLEISEAAGDVEGVGLANNGLGIVAMNLADNDGALLRFEGALKAFRELGDPAGTAMAAGNLGELHLQRGELDEARRYMEESVELAKKHRTFVAVMLPDHLRIVARLCIQTKRVSEAVKHLTECFRLIGQFESKLDTAYSLETISELALAIAENGSPDEGRPALEFAASGEGAAESLRRRIGSPVPPGEMEERREIVERLRRSLGADDFQGRFEAGRTLSWADAVASTRQFLESLAIVEKTVS